MFVPAFVVALCAAACGGGPVELSSGPTTTSSEAPDPGHAGPDVVEVDASDAGGFDAGELDAQQLDSLVRAVNEVPGELAELTLDQVSAESKPCYAANELLAYSEGIPSVPPGDDPTDDLQELIAVLPADLREHGRRILEWVLPAWDAEALEFSTAELAEIRADDKFRRTVGVLEGYALQGCVS